MSNRDIAAVAFRLAGIFVAVHAIESLTSVSWLAEHLLKPVWLGDLRDSAILHFAIARFTITLMLIAIAGILLFRCHRLAERMFPHPETEQARGRMLGLHAFAYSVVGLFLIATGLSALGMRLMSVMVWGVSETLRELVEPGIRLLLGIALWFGSYGLVRIWSRLRYAGLRREMGLCAHCGYDLMGNTSGV